MSFMWHKVRMATCFEGSQQALTLAHHARGLLVARTLRLGFVRACRSTEVR